MCVVNRGDRGRATSASQRDGSLSGCHSVPSHASGGIGLRQTLREHPVPNQLLIPCGSPGVVSRSRRINAHAEVPAQFDNPSTELLESFEAVLPGYAVPVVADIPVVPRLTFGNEVRRRRDRGNGDDGGEHAGVGHRRPKHTVRTERKPREVNPVRINRSIISGERHYLSDHCRRLFLRSVGLSSQAPAERFKPTRR